MTKLNFNDRDLLSSIADYKILTVKQLSIISQRSCRVVRRRMRALTKEGVIATRMEGCGGGRGRPEDLLFLTENGAALLVDNGVRRPETVMGKVADRLFLDHLLLMNWFRIHLLQIERFIPELSVRYVNSESLARAYDTGGGVHRSEQNGNQENAADFIPDAVFAITRKGGEPKTLLFFLEVDMGTETIASPHRNRKDLRQKILNYQMFFRTSRYKRYQGVFDSKLNGFRLLFLTNSSARMISLCRLVREMPPSDFIWLAEEEKMFSNGLSARIWARGGQEQAQPQSILGSELARELPIIDKQ